MIENALQIMLLMWAISFSVVGFQFIAADTVGLELQNYEGEPLRSHLVGFVNQQEINTITQNIVEADFRENTTAYNKIEQYPVAAAFVAWELVLLLTGTYVFSFLHLLGVPIFFVTILVFMYFALLARAILGYVRGV